MELYGRRTFIKRSAGLAGAFAALGISGSSVAGHATAANQQKACSLVRWKTHGRVPSAQPQSRNFVFTVDGGIERLLAGKKFSDYELGIPGTIQLPYQLVKEDLVQRAHNRNIKVHAWTVNELDKMYLMWNRAVDGIITDYPGPLMALLNNSK